MTAVTSDHQQVKSVKEVSLSLTELVDAPRNVEVSVSKATSLSLEWHLPNTPVMLKYFLVRYAEVYSENTLGPVLEVQR